MAILKAISGHGSLVENRCREYILGIGYWEDKYHGKRCNKITYINILPDEENDLNWDEEMDLMRIDYKTDTKKNDNLVRTYNHYIFSPSPKDNVTVDELDKALTEWTERVFKNKFSIVIAYHNDNTNHVQHAHMYINNVNLDEDPGCKRIGNYVTPQCWEYASQLWQYMCKQRGWFSFIEKQKEDLERQNLSNEGKYENELIKPTKETEKLFTIDEEYFKQYKYFNHDIDYKRPFKKMVNLDNKSIKKAPFSTKQGKWYTKGAIEAKRRGEHLWTDDIRNLIEISYYQSNNITDFIELLNAYDIKVELTNDKDFKFTHPEKETWTVTGKKLGNDYRRDRIMLLFNKLQNAQNAEYRPDYSQNKEISKKIRELGYTVNKKHISYKDAKGQLTLEDLAKTIRLCSQLNCWNSNDLKDLNINNDEAIKSAIDVLSNLESLSPIREQFENTKKLNNSSQQKLDIKKEKYRRKLLNNIEKLDDDTIDNVSELDNSNRAINKHSMEKSKIKEEYYEH